MSKITYFVMPISVMLMMLFVSLTISGIFGFDDGCPIASNFPNVKVNYSSNTRIIVDREKVYLQESIFPKRCGRNTIFKDDGQGCILTLRGCAESISRIK
uniref:Uncharacterized protein n=1 Tax=Acrobeloides nanus TaxID=290746 RepID=A0A914CJD8_9BILA